MSLRSLDFGVVLELDPKTANHTDFREARLRLGVCEERMIPPFTWIRYRDPNGDWSRQFESNYQTFFKAIIKLS